MPAAKTADWDPAMYEAKLEDKQAGLVVNNPMFDANSALVSGPRTIRKQPGEKLDMIFSTREGTTTIIRCTIGGAAWKAGVRTGNVLLEVNGKQVVALSHKQIVSIFKESDTLIKMVVDVGEENEFGAPSHGDAGDYLVVTSAGGLAEGDEYLEMNRGAKVAQPLGPGDNVVTLKRINGKQLGLRFGDAPSQVAGVPVAWIDAAGQAHGKLALRDRVVAINGTSCRGFGSDQAGQLMALSDTLKLTLERPSTQSEGRARAASVDSFGGFGKAANAAPSTLTATLDRSDGRALGVKLGDAWSPSGGVQILSVVPDGQASGKLEQGDQVLAINGVSCRGFDKQQAANLIKRSAIIKFTFVRRPAPANGGATNGSMGDEQVDPAGELSDEYIAVSTEDESNSVALAGSAEVSSAEFGFSEGAADAATSGLDASRIEFDNVAAVLAAPADSGAKGFERDGSVYGGFGGPEATDGGASLDEVTGGGDDLYEAIDNNGGGDGGDDGGGFYDQDHPDADKYDALAQPEPEPSGFKRSNSLQGFDADAN